MVSFFLCILQCKPDITELSGPENKSLISWFGLFCLGKTGSNLGPAKKSLLYSGFSYIRVRLQHNSKKPFTLLWSKNILVLNYHSLSRFLSGCGLKDTTHAVCCVPGLSEPIPLQVYIWFEVSFPSPKLVVILILKSPDWPTTYP